MKKCDCGRSPTPYCVGWHNLSHELWQTKKLIAAAPETWKKMPTPKTAPEQVAALVALGFSAADAEPYADAALSLDQILDHMCADGVVRV